MEDTVKNLLALRNRQRAALVQFAKDNPGNEAVANLLALDKELCAALTSAAQTHGAKLGLTDVTTQAVTAPKD